MSGLPANFGNFEFLGELGQGPTGAVYKVRHRQREEVVALKWVSHPDATLRDASDLAQLNSEGIVSILETGEHAGRVFVVTEYYAQGSLEAWLNDGGPLPPRVAAAFVRTLCRTVEQAHAAGIIHGRLKPTDVLIQGDQQPRLNDYAIDSPTADALDRFRPPEAEATKLGDIFRLGGILYAALTAQPPLAKNASIKWEPIAPRKLVGGIRHPLQDICLRCLSRSPKARYQTVAELAEDLDRFLSNRPLDRAKGDDDDGLWPSLVQHPIAVTLPLAIILLILFPPTVAAGLVAAILGLFLVPRWDWRGPAFGVASSLGLLLLFWSRGRLFPTSPPWKPPQEIGWAVIGLGEFVAAAQSPVAHVVGYLLAGLLAGWAWQSLAIRDQRQQTRSARLYLLVLFPALFLVAFDDLLMGWRLDGILQWSAVGLLVALGIPCGMLLSQIARLITGFRVTADNAKLAGLLSLLLAAMAMKWVPVGRAYDWYGYGRALRVAHFLPPVLLNSTHQMNAILTPVLIQLSLLGMLAIAGTIVMTAMASFPKTAVLCGLLGLVLNGVFIFTKTYAQEPIPLPGGNGAIVLMVVLVLVVLAVPISRAAGWLPAKKPPVTPPRSRLNFNGRLFVFALVIGVAVAMAGVFLNIIRRI